MPGGERGLGCGLAPRSPRPCHNNRPELIIFELSHWGLCGLRGGKLSMNFRSCVIVTVAAPVVAFIVLFLLKLALGSELRWEIVLLPLIIECACGWCFLAAWTGLVVLASSTSMPPERHRHHSHHRRHSRSSSTDSMPTPPLTHSKRHTSPASSRNHPHHHHSRHRSRSPPPPTTSDGQAHIEIEIPPGKGALTEATPLMV